MIAQFTNVYLPYKATMSKTYDNATASEWVKMVKINNNNVFYKTCLLTTQTIQQKWNKYWWYHIEGLVQNCSNSIANALELLHKAIDIVHFFKAHFLCHLSSKKTTRSLP